MPADKLLRQPVAAFLSPQHLSHTVNHCPPVALPLDEARASKTLRDAFEDVLSLDIRPVRARSQGPKREPGTGTGTGRALRCCVGGMTLARTAAASAFTDEIREAALEGAPQLMSCPSPAKKAEAG